MTSCLMEQVPEKQEGSRWWADGNESSFLFKKIEENEDIKAKCSKTLNRQKNLGDSSVTNKS